MGRFLAYVLTIILCIIIWPIGIVVLIFLLCGVGKKKTIVVNNGVNK